MLFHLDLLAFLLPSIFSHCGNKVTNSYCDVFLGALTSVHCHQEKLFIFCIMSIRKHHLTKNCIFFFFHFNEHWYLSQSLFHFSFNWWTPATCFLGSVWLKVGKWLKIPLVLREVGKRRWIFGEVFSISYFQRNFFLTHHPNNFIPWKTHKRWYNISPNRSSVFSTSHKT